MRAIMRAVAKNSSGLLAALFVALRLAGVTDWPWWWVLAPVWILAVLLWLVPVIAMIAVARIQARRAMRGAFEEFASLWPGSVVARGMRRRDVRRLLLARGMRRRDVRRLLAGGASGPSAAGAAGIPGFPDFGEILERHLRDQGWSPPEDPQ
jgi:hypothetical protein